MTDQDDDDDDGAGAEPVHLMMERLKTQRELLGLTLIPLCDGSGAPARRT